MRMPRDQNILKKQRRGREKRPRSLAHTQIFVGDESNDNERSVAFSKGEKVAAKPTDEESQIKV